MHIMIKTLKNIKFLAAFVLSDLVILGLIFYAMTISNIINDTYVPLADAVKASKYELVLSQLAVQQSSPKALQHINNAEAYMRTMAADQYTHFLGHDITLSLKQITLLKNRVSNKKLSNNTTLTSSFQHTLTLLTNIETELFSFLKQERNKQKERYLLILFCTAMLLLLVSIHYRRSKIRDLKNIQDLKEIASTDALTGISNRRCFDKDLEYAWGYALRGGYPLSIALCDIDFFKKYNDSLGHQAGDRCLKKVADIMQATLRRPVDKVARYGGEEFVFLLPFTDSDGAEKIMSKLQKNLQHDAIPHPASTCANHITLSIGIFTILPDTSISSGTAVNNADQALYQAKSLGRNQIHHFGKT